VVAYYNDNDPKACAWLRELIKAGLIADGDVDERGIEEVKPSDIAGYVQCHWFAGVGGWSRALRLAGWPDDEPVWTGSCPCQPFSCAGKGLGEDDPRHLWPQFMRLIRECHPITVFGEQVEGAIRKGWLDGVFADLEGEGYTCGAAVLGAHSVGAPHIRQRLYWMADAKSGGIGGCEGAGRRGISDEHSEPDRLADSESGRIHRRQFNPSAKRLSQDTEPNDGGHWSNAILIPCADGKARRVEPTIQPLAPRLPGRVGLLRGAGNAIVPQVAQAFIEGYLATECGVISEGGRADGC